MRAAPHRLLGLGLVLIASLGVKHAHGQCLDNTDCDDGNLCTNDVCIPTGTCENPPLADGTLCADDGLFCNGLESCTGGFCASAGDPCGGAACDEIFDTCACLVDADCDDGAYCSGMETCAAGTCLNGAPIDCSALDDVCANGVCNELSDACIKQPINQGLPCDDADVCTVADVCNAGYCVGTRTEGCCAIDAHCNDHNDCTLDSCVANLCTHTPLNPGSPCGSGTATECTDPDACDGAGLCQPNDIADGAACSGALDCLAGQCSPTTFTPTVLPEGSFAGSVPHAGSCNGSTGIVVGVGVDNLDVEHAVAWSFIDSDADGVLNPLPEMGETTSAAIGVSCEQTTGECVAVGSIGAAGAEQPAYWSRDDLTGDWTGAVASLPAGFTGGRFGGEVLGELDMGGIARAGARGGDGMGDVAPPFMGGERNTPGINPGATQTYRSSDGTVAPPFMGGENAGEVAHGAALAGVWTSIGTGTAPSGDAKALYWPDLTQPPVVLPELVMAAGRESVADDVDNCPQDANADQLCTPGARLITGRAEDGLGVLQPVVWRESGAGTGSFEMFTLPLPPGAVGMVRLADVNPPGTGVMNSISEYVLDYVILNSFRVAGTVELVDGSTRGVSWRIIDLLDLPEAVDALVLPPAPGYGSSVVTGFTDSDLDGIESQIGTSYPTGGDPVTDGVATRWVGRFDDIGAVLDKIVDLNDLAVLQSSIRVSIIVPISDEGPCSGSGGEVLAGLEGGGMFMSVLVNTGGLARANVAPPFMGGERTGLTDVAPPFMGGERTGLTDVAPPFMGGERTGLTDVAPPFMGGDFARDKPRRYGTEGVVPPSPHAGLLVPIPRADIPAVSEWGLAAFALLMLSAGCIVVRRRPVRA